MLAINPTKNSNQLNLENNKFKFQRFFQEKVNQFLEQTVKILSNQQNRKTIVKSQN